MGPRSEGPNYWKQLEYGLRTADWELPAKMRGSAGKKIAMVAGGLCKNVAAGMVGIGISMFAPRVAPLLGIGALIADDDGPKRALFLGVRFVIVRLGKKPPAFLNLIDGGDEHEAALEPSSFSMDAVCVAMRPFSTASAFLLGREQTHA